MNKLLVEGYASIFNEVDSHNDKILPGAYTKCLKLIEKFNYTIPIFLEHNETLIIGKVVKFTQNKKGLWIRAEIFDPIHAPRIQNVLDNGIALGLSIGYTAAAVNWIDENHKNYATFTDEQRNITDVHLHEVSIVKWPSNSHCVAKKSKKQ